MNISMDIIACEFQEYIVAQQLRDDSAMNLSSCQFYDRDQDGWEDCYVYLCRADELPPADTLPEGISIICTDTPDGGISKYRHINILILSGVGIRTLANLTLRLFRKYLEFDLELDRLTSSAGSLQKMVEFAAEIIGSPLCMLDINHNVIAITTNLPSTEDKLWDSMMDGYGYAFSDVVEESEPKLSYVAEVGSVELINNVSGHYICVSALYRDKRPVAFLGLHKLGEYQQPFEKYTKQLYLYVIDKLTNRVNVFTDLKTGRGRIYEQFLLDIIEGKLTDSQEIRNLSARLDIEPSSNFQICLIAFDENKAQTDYHYSMMDYIENLIPHSKCILYEQHIVVFFLLESDKYLRGSYQTKLAGILKSHKGMSMISPMFSDPSHLNKIIEQVKFALQNIQRRHDTAILHHYHEFMTRHSIKIFAERFSLESAIHPKLRDLLDYDIEHNGEYYKTLCTYLRNNCNMSLTAKIIHLHRNTVIYRLSKIEELLGDKLESWELRRQLLFSLECIDYQKGLESHQE